MGDVLGIGLSHYPPFSGTDDDMSAILRRTLQDPAIPPEHKDSANWPALMQQEWAGDQGTAAAAAHRAVAFAAFRTLREKLDEFQPDIVVIWGDDQYENFREDIIPPYSVLVYDDLDVKPWEHAAESSAMKDRANYWGEPEDTVIRVKGRPDIGRYLTTTLLERGIDISYAYTGLHHPGLPHAFLNSVLYLDSERKGFDYPVLCFPVNCYGRRVVSYKGFMSEFGDVRELDPPSPMPHRLLDVGAAVARACVESPWRVALIASSSWSHAFTCDRTWRVQPDTAADRRLYDSLVSGDIQTWRSTPLAEIEAAGQQELLNWFCLVGAMHELGRPTPEWSTFVPTYVFNSNKVFVSYAVVPG